MSSLRTLTNKIGATFDTERTDIFFAEDWAQLKAELDILSRTKDIWPTIFGPSMGVSSLSIVYCAPFYNLSDTSLSSQAFVSLLNGSVSRLCILKPAIQPASGSFYLEIFKNGIATGKSITIPASSPAGLYTLNVEDLNFSTGNTFHYYIRNFATGSVKFSNIQMEVLYDA